MVPRVLLVVLLESLALRLPERLPVVLPEDPLVGLAGPWTTYGSGEEASRPSSQYGKKIKVIYMADTYYGMDGEPSSCSGGQCVIHEKPVYNVIFHHTICVIDPCQ